MRYLTQMMDVSKAGRKIYRAGINSSAWKRILWRAIFPIDSKQKKEKRRRWGGEERSSRLKFNRVSDLLPAPMKAKISNNYRRGISYRFLQARAFHCPRKEAEWNQGRERGGGERGKKKQRRREGKRSRTGRDTEKRGEETWAKGW